MASNISCNDNQNYFVQQGRTTSRVLAPPGGFTSLSFGCEEPQPKKKEEPALTTVAKEASVPTEGIAPQVLNESEPVTLKVESSSTVPTQSEFAQKEIPVSSNAFASGCNMNGAQVMTGRPTSRVLAPPGGHTSIKLW